MNYFHILKFYSTAYTRYFLSHCQSLPEKKKMWDFSHGGLLSARFPLSFGFGCLKNSPRFSQEKLRFDGWFFLALSIHSLTSDGIVYCKLTFWFRFLWFQFTKQYRVAGFYCRVWRLQLLSLLLFWCGKIMQKIEHNIACHCSFSTARLEQACYLALSSIHFELINC